MESEAATNPGVGNTLDILVSDTWGYPKRDIWRAVRRKTLLSCFYESSDKCVTLTFPSLFFFFPLRPSWCLSGYYV